MASNTTMTAVRKYSTQEMVREVGGEAAVETSCFGQHARQWGHIVIITLL